MRMDERERQRKQLLCHWRCEQAPSMDGPWITADSADGAVTIAIAPPGTAITGTEGEACQRWRMAWWTVGRDGDLLGFSPAGELVVPFDDLLTFMPAAIANRARVWERTAREQQQALAVGSPQTGIETDDMTQEHAMSTSATVRSEGQAGLLQTKASRKPDLNLLDALRELATG